MEGGELLLQAVIGLASAFVGGSAVYAGIKADLAELRATQAAHGDRLKALEGNVFAPRRFDDR
ncbi:MAG: hypothetical protein ACOYLX_12220 [Burkholderiaceae bacterium]